MVDDDDAFAADIVAVIRQIGRDIVDERAALLAVVYQHASPALLDALSAYLERPVRIGPDEHRESLSEARARRLH